MTYAILGDASLRLESEYHLHGFISKSAEANQEVFVLLEFLKLEFCSMDVTDHLLGLFS
jgi:hypothetical protein